MHAIVKVAWQAKKTAKAKDRTAAAVPQLEAASRADDREPSGATAAHQPTSRKKSKGSRPTTDAVTGVATEQSLEQSAAEPATKAGEQQPAAPGGQKKRKRKRDAAGGGDGTGKQS